MRTLRNVANRLMYRLWLQFNKYFSHFYFLNISTLPLRIDDDDGKVMTRGHIVRVLSVSKNDAISAGKSIPLSSSNAKIKGT